MPKNFDEWNKVKTLINDQNNFSDFKSGQIWWVSLGLNVGSEQDGAGIGFERPFLIVKKFSSNTFFGFPLTSKNKIGNYYYNINDKNTVVLCQPRILDSKRLKREIKNNPLSRKKFEEIIFSFKKLF